MAMGQLDGSIRIGTQMDTSGLQDGVKNITSQVGGLKSALKSLGKVAITAFAVRGLFNFGREAISISSDLTEVQNVVETAFGGMSGAVDEWSKGSIKNFGMSELAAKRTASTYMAMSKGMGQYGEAAGKMAMEAAERTADIASFYNVSQAEADIMLKSIWTGETESLKRIGVVMTQTNLDAYALANGFGKTTSAMSQAEQVQLRFQYVMEQTRLAAGDFAKTQDSWANQTRILSEQWKQLMGIVGNGLVQVLAPAVKMLNAMLSQLIAFAQMASAALSALFGKKVAKTQAAAAAATNANAAAQEGLGSAIKGAGNEAAKAGKKAKGALAPFDELNVLSKSSGSSGAGGSGSSPGGAGAAVGPIDFPVTGVEEINTDITALQALLQPTIDAFGRLGDQLSRLGGFAWQGLQDFYNTFLVPVGKWVMGEGLPRFIDALADGFAKVDWRNINDSLHRLWEALAPFAVHVGEGLLWLWENVLVPFGSWTMNNVVPLFIDILSGAIESINTTIENFAPAAQFLWDYFLKPIAEWTGGVIVGVLQWLADHMSALTPIILGLVAAWGAYQAIILAAEIAQKAVTIAQLALNAAQNANPIMLIITVIGALIGAFIALWNNNEDFRNFWIGLWDKIKEVAKAVADWFCETWDAICEWFGHLWDGIKNFAISAWEGIKAVWNTVKDWFNNYVIQPIADFFSGLWDGVKNFANNCIVGIKYIWGKVSEWFNNTIIQPIKNFFGGMWDALKNGASAAWEGIKSVFSGVVNWFKDKFSAAWNAVKNVFSVGGKIFSGITEGISNMFKKVVNAIIDGLNKIIAFPFNKINGFLNTIRNISILGVSPFKGLWGQNPLPVPQIPKLAKGAVIPPNQEFAAILGDQRSGRNLEAPEGLIRDIVSQEAGGESMYQAMMRAWRDARGNRGDMVLQVGEKEIGRIAIQSIIDHLAKTGELPFPV